MYKIVHKCNFNMRLSEYGIYRRTRGIRLTGLSPFCKKGWIVQTLHFPFLIYSYACAPFECHILILVNNSFPTMCGTPYFP